MRNLALLPLAAAIIALPACGGGGGGGGSAANPAAPPNNQANVVEVIVDDFTFTPKQLQIEPGTTVRFVHRGADPTHTTTATNNRWDSGFAFADSGNAFEVTFNDGDDDQTFEYRCDSHKNCCMMQGSIKVGTNAPDAQAGY